MATTTLTIQPDPTAGKDAFVNEDQVGTNYGSSVGLTVRGSTPEYRSFLQFDLSGIPAAATITSAVLRLNLTSVLSSTSLSMRAAPVSASWDETTVAWFNQPGVLASDLSPIVAVTDSVGSWFEFDVTSMASSWHDGAYTNNGLRVAPTETGARSRTFASSDYTADVSLRPQLVVTYEENTAPNAPYGLSPNGTTINEGNTNRFSWTFSDPDSGDSQSGYDLRYRLTSVSAWTTVSGTTPNSYRDFPAGTFAAGDYEWQVRTYDAQGLVGPYSSSGFFTAAAAPAGPTITDPIAGQTIPAETYTVRWSTPSQTAYQVRTVADALGSPDTATVYTDTGEVTSSTGRSRSVSFATNGRDEHVQVRVKDAGLWSSWSSVNVTVSYTRPATPTVAVDDATVAGALLVQASHPAPTGSQPTVTHVDVYRRVTSEGGEGIRVATDLAATALFTDWAVASGVDYSYRVRAWGDNGTSAWSDWSEEPTSIDVDYGGAYE